MKHAANKPAPSDHNSFVKKYVEIAVNPLQYFQKINHSYTPELGIFYEHWLPKYGSEKYANISDVNGYVQRMQYIVYTARCYHQSRVYSTTDDPTERVPCSFVEPI